MRPDRTSARIQDDGGALHVRSFFLRWCIAPIARTLIAAEDAALNGTELARHFDFGSALYALVEGGIHAQRRGIQLRAEMIFQNASHSFREIRRHLRFIPARRRIAPYGQPLPARALGLLRGYPAL